MSGAPDSPVIAALRGDERQRAWLEHLETLDASDPVVVPEGEGLAAILRELDVPEEDIPAILASRPSPDDAAAWWIIQRSVAALRCAMGQLAPPPAFPSPLQVAGMSPWFFVHVFAAVLPFTREYLREHGIPEIVARETLADLGRNVRVHRRWYGEGGLGVASWLTLHFRGMIYQLGRLQFERAWMGDDIAAVLRDRGEDVSAETPVLSLHIPAFLGPLSPDAIDDSLERARAFFPEHFPSERHAWAVCDSWLLDPQLAQRLPETSNIVRFQRRFDLTEETHDADASIVRFVIGKAPDDPRELPQRTALERAIREHLLNGGHWHARAGWFRFR